MKGFFNTKRNTHIVLGEKKYNYKWSKMFETSGGDETKLIGVANLLPTLNLMALFRLSVNICFVWSNHH